MARRLHAGSVIPEFQYDTPYRPQQSFYGLLEGEKPVFLVFLRNFGHPITRHYILRYIESADELRSARLVCVVRTRPHVISRAIPEGAMPYEIICDAEGVLYRFFDVPEEHSKLKSYSLEALKILKAAKRQGFSSAKNEPQQLPLTVLAAPGGRVLFAHYGASLTDMPADCEAMQRVAEELLPSVRPDWLAHGAAVRRRAGAGASAPMPAAVEVEIGGAPGEPEVAVEFSAPQHPAAQESAPEGFFTGFEPVEPLAAAPGAAPQAAPEPELWEALLSLSAEPAAPADPLPPAQDPLAVLLESPEPAAKAVDLAALGFGPGN